MISRCRVLRVFSRLYKSKLTYKEISEEQKVSISFVRNIATCITHKWLAEDYPSKYFQMKERRERGATKFISPSGEIVEIANVRRYFIEVKKVSNPGSYASGLSQVKNRKLKQFKGWRLLDE